MFWREPTLLEREFERALRELSKHEVGSQEYAKTLKMVVDLHRLKEVEKPSPMSKDTVITVGANLMSILMIIHHEHLNPITTRALGLVLKPKI